MKTKAVFLLLALVLVAIPEVARSAPANVGLAVSTDYDATKDQTTFHLLNVSGKQINAWELSLQVKLADGSFSPAGQSFAGIDYVEGGLAPGAIEDFTRPGVVIGVVDLVMYSDGTADVLNEGAHKQIIADRNGRVQANQKISELINAALSDPNEKHPTEKVVAQLKALLVSQTTNGAWRGELEGAMRNIGFRIGSPHMSEAGWEAGQLKEFAQQHQDRAATIKAVRQ